MIAQKGRESRSTPASRMPSGAAPRPSDADGRVSWARLLKRVFDLDIERCPNCGGSLKIIAWS